jgi:hopanoid-associated phosphorylase
MPAPVLVATGLDFEAAIAAGPGVQVLCGQGEYLTRALNDYLEHHPAAGVVSFGTAGGLVDTLRPGDWIVGRAVIEIGQDKNSAPMPCDIAWSETLRQALPGATHADIAAVTAPVATMPAKRALHGATGAHAADMESQIVAHAAQAHGLPFVCCRVIIDPVQRTLPPAALTSTRADGTVDIMAVLRSLAAHPGQLPELLAVGRDAAKAKRALKAGRTLIGNGFGRTAA